MKNSEVFTQPRLGRILKLTLVLTILVMPKVMEARLEWTNIQTSTSRDLLDLWTQKASGCTCPDDVLDNSCPCCVSNGCQCTGLKSQRCGQCGLEQYCDEMCNITISSVEMKARSGQAFGEIKSPTALSGPAFCWYHLVPDVGERVEVQIYRIKRLGELHLETNRCVGGFMQLQGPMSEELAYNPDQLAICGPNERYSPPIVIFKDGVSATLLFRVDETTSRSQFLAHYAFPSVNHPDTGIGNKGGTQIGGDPTSDCVWKFEEELCQQNGQCQIASPGYPGIYPPNTRCRFHLQSSSKGAQIKVTFTRFNLPQTLCDSHYVDVFKGSNTNGSPMESLCGYIGGSKVVTLDKGKHLTLEFVSGQVIPPIDYNGFKATVEFISRAKGGGRLSSSGNEDDVDEDDDGGQSSKKQNKGRKNRGRKGDGRRKSKQNKKKTQSKSTNSKYPNSGCIQEFNANESRSGRISSSSLSLNNQGCTVIFRGQPGDVLLLSFNSFKLRGRDCNSYIRISQPFSSLGMRRNNKEDTEEVERICSPATRRIYDGQGSYISRPPILVNSSVVFLQFQANRQSVDRFEAAFSFHDVMSQGLPSPNSTCTALFPGRTGHPKGTIQSPGDSDIFQRLEGPLTCTKSLVPSDSQSLTLTINSANDAASASLVHGGLVSSAGASSSSSRQPLDRCETLCDERGCHCLTDGDQPFSQIDHLMVRARNGGRIACFCGSFEHLLPLNIISSSSLSIVYNVMDFGAENRFSYKAAFAFHNEETCGPRRISIPIGSLESPLSASSSTQAYHPSSTYFHHECQWFFDPPPAKQLILKISTAQKMTDCLTWNATIAIWNASLPDQIGTLIDRFCPEISAKEYILNITTRKIVISLHSLSMGPIHYRISWETHGLLPRDPSGDHTKEVIGGGGLIGTSEASGVIITSRSFVKTLLLTTSLLTSLLGGSLNLHPLLIGGYYCC